MPLRLTQASQSDSRSHHQQETAANGELCREAQEACIILGDRWGRRRNTPNEEALRAAYKGREAEYLFAQYGEALMWTSLNQARDFYRRNK